MLSGRCLSGYSFLERGLGTNFRYATWQAGRRFHVSLSKEKRTEFCSTEYGAIRLKGMSTTERARSLIDIAHPNHRAALGTAPEEISRS